MKLGIINGWDEAAFRYVSDLGLEAVEFCCNYNYDSMEVAGHVDEIKGFSEKYGVAEVKNPVRTLTSTVRIEGVSALHPALALLPVKTDKPIPKAKLRDGMKLIKTLSVRAPLASGSVVYEDFIEKGVNLISGRDI